MSCVDVMIYSIYFHLSWLLFILAHRFILKKISECKEEKKRERKGIRYVR